jgi:monoamine oxidase
VVIRHSHLLTAKENLFVANYVIVGAGASGLYTAFQLLKSGKVQSTDTVQIFEWSHRPGGRIFTYSFPAPAEWKKQGLYVELGGMRFAADAAFPNLPSSKCEGHVLVQSMILQLGLQNKVRDFQQSENRLYYLRGTNVYENNLTPQATHQLPYGFNKQFFDFVSQIPQQPPTAITADSILGQIGEDFAPGLGTSNSLRGKWCHFYANGTVAPKFGTLAFPAGTPIKDIGYWNLLYDQLGDEGFDYSADGTGYTSNVINWNSADAMQANNDYSSTTKYKRIDGGYSQLFVSMAEAIEQMGGRIHYGQRLTSLEESPDGTQTYCSFVDRTEASHILTADYLFLAMPRRSLEMVADGCPQNYMLNQPAVKFWRESSIDQPAIKAVTVFDEPWWAGPDCAYPPNLLWPSDAPQPAPPSGQQVGGATITDLPLRMVYYFGNNIPNGPGNQGGPYVLLASYDDMTYSDFWRQVEVSGDYKEAPSSIHQPLHGPTRLDPQSSFAQLLRKQLAELHGVSLEKVPLPSAVLFQDWGQDPYGGGYHGWAAHYNICQAMDNMRAPYANILGNTTTKTYIVGSCYSFDQAWVEGAFCTAQSVLEDFFGLPVNPYGDGYHLVCTPSD